LLGSQTTYAKTELFLSQNQVVFSIEPSQSFQSLEKELQPNIGFLKEKTKFVAVQSVSAQNTYNFSERVSEYLANGGGDAASHAEVLALDALIKEMKIAGVYSSKADLSKISVLVKGKGSWGNMCRCPHCFYLTDGVNMIGH